MSARTLLERRSVEVEVGVVVVICDRCERRANNKAPARGVALAVDDAGVEVQTDFIAAAKTGGWMIAKPLADPTHRGIVLCPDCAPAAKPAAPAEGA